MSWIQENKFVAGLGGVTAVIGGAIIFFAAYQGSVYGERLQQYEELRSQYAQLEKAKPYPTAENLSARDQGIADYHETIGDVRGLVMGFRPDKLESISPEKFKDERVKMVADLNAAFKASETELPEDCSYGFEKYAIDQVKLNATAKLKYEMDAMRWMLSHLAALKPQSINNILRAELPEESGRQAVVRTRGRRSGGRNASVAPKAAGRAYQLMPMELSFTADEAVVRKFLVGLSNSKEYYYSIRGLRIRNIRQSPPTHADANFPAGNASDGADGFGAIEGFPDADAGGVLGEDLDVAAEQDAVQPEYVEEVVPPGELILKQVLGSEKLQVHICLDIVLIEKKSEAATKPGARNGR